jgi:hypothetical protein
MDFLKNRVFRVRFWISNFPEKRRIVTMIISARTYLDAECEATRIVLYKFEKVLDFELIDVIRINDKAKKYDQNTKNR